MVYDFNGNLGDLLMLAVVLLTFHAAIFYAVRRRNFIVAAWVLPLLWLVAHYAFVAFDVEPYNSHLEMQREVIRPSLFFLLLFIVLFLFNGRVNDWISRLLDGLSHVWPFHSNKR